MPNASNSATCSAAFYQIPATDISVAATLLLEEAVAIASKLASSFGQRLSSTL